MADFKIEFTGMEEAIKTVNLIAPKQMPFIMALALTETARDVEFIVKRAIQTDVDRPRDFTINSIFSTRANKTKLEAAVQWKEFPGKGTAGGKYLRPIAEGGSRSLKRSEVSLRRMGLLPAGYFIVPGQDAKLDQNGNVSGSVYVQMLSALRAFSEQGYIANRKAQQDVRNYSKRLKQLNDFDSKKIKKRAVPTPWFVILPGTGNRLAPGIYKRFKSKRELIFAIVREPKYHISFPFAGITTRAARERMPIQFDIAVQKAMATAKRF